MSLTLDELIQKMTTLELIVGQLLSLGKATPIQREKLEQLEAMIGSIPEQCEYTATVWRSKLSALKKSYDSVLAKAQDALPYSVVDSPSDAAAANRRSVQFDQDGLKVTVRTLPTLTWASIISQPGLPSVKVEPTDDLPWDKVPEIVVKEEPTDAKCTLDLPQLWMKQEEVTDYQTDTDNDDHSVDSDRSSVDSMADQLGDLSLINKRNKATWPKLKSVIVVPEGTRQAFASDVAVSRDTRQSLKSKLGRKFAKVPVVADGSDFRHLKTLLRTVMQTFDLVPPQLADPQLQSLAFNLAAGKLAQSYAQLYLAEYNDASLYSLFSFLRLEMEAYTDNFLYQLVASGKARIPKEKATIWHNCCAKCHIQGHTLDVCPLNLCPNCFAPGHSIYACTRGPIFTNNN